MRNRDPAGLPRAGGILAAWLVLMAAAHAALPADRTSATDAGEAQLHGRGHVRHPHCGLYCLYAALRLTGHRMDARELIKPDYISSHKGSSLSELKKAAEDHGLYALPVTGLSLQALRKCSHMMILHVKSEVASESYDHYQLWLGTAGGKARLFDPPEPVQCVSFHELAPRWRGSGLILSPRPIAVLGVLGPGYVHLGFHVLCAVVFVVIVRLLRQRLWPALAAHGRQRVGWSVGQAVGVYCQSADCPFAERVAVRLTTDGFSNISIFRGGWNKWAATRPP